MICYVLGCGRTDFYVEREHKFFGHVTSCPAHDPARHGYEVQPPQSAVEPTQSTQAGASDTEGGSKVPRVPIKPRKPSPAAAVARPF